MGLDCFCYLESWYDAALLNDASGAAVKPVHVA